MLAGPCNVARQDQNSPELDHACVLFGRTAQQRCLLSALAWSGAGAGRRPGCGTAVAYGAHGFGQASLRRRWPGDSTVLDGVAADLQRRDLRLEQVLFGCRFPNPVGLAAGFDKNGVAAGIWDRFGFGFAEVGTVAQHGQPGNPKPRLFRLAEEQAALNGWDSITMVPRRC